MRTIFPSGPVRRAAGAAAAGLALAAAFGGAALLSGCGGSSSGAAAAAGRSGRAAMTIVWPSRTVSDSRLIPLAAGSIVVTFAQGGAPVATKAVARPASGDTTTVAFDVLPAGALTVTATAYPNADGTGTALATASEEVNIADTGVTPVAITMASTIDHLTVTPETPTVAVGATVALAATAYDAGANMVLTSASKIAWASSDPATAAVDGSGVVTGVAEGTATVTATDTESGKGVTTTVTVTAAAVP